PLSAMGKAVAMSALRGCSFCGLFERRLLFSVVGRVRHDQPAVPSTLSCWAKRQPPISETFPGVTVTLPDQSVASLSLRPKRSLTPMSSAKAAETESAARRAMRGDFMARNETPPPCRGCAAASGRRHVYPAGYDS